MDAIGWLGNWKQYKLSIKAKNKQATSFYIKLQGILPKAGVYSESCPTSSMKDLCMRCGSLCIVPVSGFYEMECATFQMP